MNPRRGSVFFSPVRVKCMPCAHSVREHSVPTVILTLFLAASCRDAVTSLSLCAEGSCESSVCCAVLGKHTCVLCMCIPV